MNRRHHPGFALVEVMIAIALLAMVLGSLAFFVSSRAKSEAKADLIALQAREMAMLATAVGEYLEGHGDALPPQTNTPITIAQLQGQGLLPDGFAVRNGGQGVSPFHQPYAIVARKPAPAEGDKAQAIILEAGEIPAARMVRAGVEDTSQAIQGVKRAIALAVHRDYQHPSGMSPAGETLVQGAGGSFTKGIGTFLVSAAFALPSEATAVTFVGFDELLPEPPTMPEIDGGQKWGYCNVYQPRKPHVGEPGWGQEGAYVAASCPIIQHPQTGALMQTQEIQEVPICDNRHITPRYLVYPSDIGAFTVEKTKEVSSVSLIADWAWETVGGRPGGGGSTVWSWVWRTYEDYTTQEQLHLNNEPVTGAGLTCATRNHHQGTRGGGMGGSGGGGGSCGYGYGGNPRLPTDPEDASTGERGCVLTSGYDEPPQVTWLRRDATYKVCCLPYDGASP